MKDGGSSSRHKEALGSSFGGCPRASRAKAGGGCEGRQCPLAGTGRSADPALLGTWAEMSILGTDLVAGRRKPSILYWRARELPRPRLSRNNWEKRDSSGEKGRCREIRVVTVNAAHC